MQLSDLELLQKGWSVSPPDDNAFLSTVVVQVDASFRPDDVLGNLLGPHLDFRFRNGMAAPSR